MSSTFTSSSEGLCSSPHQNTLKVGLTEDVDGSCVTSESIDSFVVTVFIAVSYMTPPPPPHPVSPDSEGVFGRVPQSILDDESSHLITAHENSLDLQNLHRVSENAYKQYLKSRPHPSPESIRRVKSADMSCMSVHPLLGQFRGGVRRTVMVMMRCRQ